MPKIPKHSFSDTQGNDVPRTPFPTTSRNSRCHSKYYQIVKEQPQLAQDGKNAVTASRWLPESSSRNTASPIVWHGRKTVKPPRGNWPAVAPAVQPGLGDSGPGGCEWRRPGSNRQPPACKAGALPVELRPRRWSAMTEIPDLAAVHPWTRQHRGRSGGRRDRQDHDPPPDPVGTRGLEPRTSALSELRSNQLSYAPACLGRLFWRMTGDVSTQTWQRCRVRLLCWSCQQNR